MEFVVRDADVNVGAAGPANLLTHGQNYVREDKRKKERKKKLEKVQ